MALDQKRAEGRTADDVRGTSPSESSGTFTRRPGFASTDRETQRLALKAHLNCSESVSDVISDVPPSRMTAARLVAVMFGAHQNYAPLDQLRRTTELLNAVPPTADAKTAIDWAREACRLIVPEQLLDGRMLIMCLAALDPMGTRALRQGDLLTRIEHDLAEADTFGPLRNRLTQEGQEAFSLIALDDDATRTMSDAAAEVDLLFREPFAEAISLRIRAMRAIDKARPLMIHLDGEWGSGKTTILNFISKQLSGETPADGKGVRWIVANYNAWQHQDLESPWWTIATSVLSQAQSTALRRRETLFSGIVLLLRHTYFRIFSGRLGTVFAAILAIVALSALSLRFAVVKAEDVETALKIAAAVFGVGITGWKILTARDDASQTFLNSRLDPMRALERHIRACIKTLSAPVIVMVDDIDRCLAGNVVKLLEGIQIMFGRAPVVFLFAGDRNWINRSFEVVYNDFQQVTPAATRSIGHRFLEKTFQISIWVPDMTAEAKRQFWSKQLGITGVAAERERRAVDLSHTDSESAILDAGEALERGDDDLAKMDYRLAAVRRLADPDIQSRLDHVLLPFCDMVEPNPRGMKRLVMLYGIVRSIDILAGRRSKSAVLARWTIMLSRWPDLARWLQAKPDRLSRSDPTERSHDDDKQELRILLEDGEVQHVLRGGEPGLAVLDAKALGELTGTHEPG